MTRGVRWYRYVEIYSRNFGSVCGTNQVPSLGDNLVTTVTDHTILKDITKDCWYGVYVFDAIFNRIRVELPQLSYLSPFTEDARRYQNYLPPVLAPFIAAANGLNLKGLVHP